MVCATCSTQYIGGSVCPSCKAFGKSSDDGEVMRKTFDEPDLKKVF